MLAVGTNRFSFIYSNIGAASISPGTSIIPGASGVEGLWTEVASAANIAKNIYGFSVWVHDGLSAGQIKDHLMDIGVDPAGGTSYAAIISNIICGESDTSTSSGSGPLGRFYYFPHFIKSGSAVAIRIQGSNATAGAVFVSVDFFGQPSHPENVRVGQYAETIGTITGSAGVAFTPGASGAEGAAWVSLGTTTRALWWWQLGVQLTSTTAAARMYFMDLAYGDATNKDIIIQDLPVNTGSSEAISHPHAQNCYCEVPAGAELWVRGSCSGVITSGWNAVAIGIGG